MKAFPLIQTRTFLRDYRQIGEPGTPCPQSVVDEFVELARQVVNEDCSTYEFIDRTRWTLASRDGWVLWGAGFRNKEFGIASRFLVDFQGRPIRSFVAIVAPFAALEPSAALPFDPTLLKSIYEKYVADVWDETALDNLKGTSRKLGEIDIAISGDAKVLQARHSLSINTNRAVVRVFAQDDSTAEELLASALAHLPSELTVVTGLNVTLHAQRAGFDNAAALDHLGAPADFAQTVGPTERAGVSERQPVQGGEERALERSQRSEPAWSPIHPGEPPKAGGFGLGKSLPELVKSLLGISTPDRRVKVQSEHQSIPESQASSAIRVPLATAPHGFGGAAVGSKKPTGTGDGIESPQASRESAARQSVPKSAGLDHTSKGAKSHEFRDESGLAGETRPQVVGFRSPEERIRLKIKELERFFLTIKLTETYAAFVEQYLEQTKEGFITFLEQKGSVERSEPRD